MASQGNLAPIGWLHPDKTGQSFPVSRTCVVGRVSPDLSPAIPIPPECRSASREHATLTVSGQGVNLADTSRFGTLVNGQLVHHASIQLESGDEIVFGLPADGWRVVYRAQAQPGELTVPADPLELLTVSDVPRAVRIGGTAIEESLGDRAFRLLTYLAGRKGEWYPVAHLEDLLWPDPDDSPYETRQALAKAKKAINELLRPYLHDQDAIESRPYRGYRMKPRLDRG